MGFVVLVCFSVQVFLLLYCVTVLVPAEAQQLVMLDVPQGILLGRQLVQPGTANIYNRFQGKPYFEFLGIPYAQPPVGSLRFKSPEPAKPWKGVRHGLFIPPKCPQLESGKVVGTEDCLYLNVYTPQLPKKNIALKAVMVWIHGGGFQSGNGYTFGPGRLIQKDIVLVTINYRIGALGYLSLQNDDISGNFGLKDQVQALKWVQENIASFGGDPNQVTIFGGSAGGASVNYLMLTPLAKGLFHRAIIQSASALGSWGFNDQPKQVATRLAKTIGLNSTNDEELLDFFSKASAESLVKGVYQIYSEEYDVFSTHDTSSVPLPCAEVQGSADAFITRTPMDIITSGEYTKVPTIIGTVDGEGIVVLYSTKKFTDDDFDDLNTNSSWAVPKNWYISDKNEKERLGKEIKDFYFNKKKLNWWNINALTNIYTEWSFTLDEQLVASSLVDQSEVPVYSYQLTLEIVQSFKQRATTRQNRFLNIRGASHGDEIFLLFNPRDRVLDLPLIGFDKYISDRITSMWANFAKTGNPNYKGLEVDWKPITKSSSSYLKIGPKLSVESGKVNQKQINFWKNLCENCSTTYASCRYL